MVLEVAGAIIGNVLLLLVHTISTPLTPIPSLWEPFFPILFEHIFCFPLTALWGIIVSSQAHTTHTIEDSQRVKFAYYASAPFLLLSPFEGKEMFSILCLVSLEEIGRGTRF